MDALRYTQDANPSDRTLIGAIINSTVM